MPRSGSTSRPRMRRGRHGDRRTVKSSRGSEVTVTRSRTERRHLSHMPLTPLGNGVLAAVLTLIATLGAVLLITSIGWVFAADHTSVHAMFSFAGTAWLVGHLLPVQWEGSTLWLPPLLLTGAIMAVAAAVGRESVRRGLQPQAPDLRKFFGGALGAYAVIAVIVAALASTASVTVSFWAVPIATVTVFGSGLAAGVWWAAGRRPLLKGRIRRPDELRAVGVGLAWLAAGATLILLVSLVSGGPTMLDNLQWLRPGWSGSLLLGLLTLIYLPTGIGWAAAFALGPGFAVGSDTVVAPWEVTVGALPQFPAFAAVPQTHTWWFLLVLVVPLIAAVRAQSWLAARSTAALGGRQRWGAAVRTAGWAAAAGGIGALLVDGSLIGRLSQLGPSALAVSGAMGTWFLVGAAMVEGWRWMRGAFSADRRAPEQTFVSVEESDAAVDSEPRN